MQPELVLTYKRPVAINIVLGLMLFGISITCLVLLMQLLNGTFNVFMLWFVIGIAISCICYSGLRKMQRWGADLYLASSALSLISMFTIGTPSVVRVIALTLSSLTVFYYRPMMFSKKDESPIVLKDDGI